MSQGKAAAPSSGAPVAGPGRVAVVVAVALMVRLLLALWSQSSFFVEPPSGMSSLYFRQGYAIAAGLGFVVGQGETNDFLKEIQRRVNAGDLVATPDSVGLGPGGLYADTLHPPGMAILVAALHRLFGAPADIPLQLFGALLDSLAAGVVYWIGSTLLGSAAGLAAGLLYALFLPQAWAVTGAQMPDGLIGPFIVAMVAAYLMALRSTRWGAVAWYVVAGLSLGIGSYLRPDYLLVPIAMFPFLWLHLRRLAPAVVASVLVTATAFATLSPWAFRNHLLHDRWIFTSSGAGATLVTGLGEFSSPWGIGPTDIDRHNEAMAQGFRSAWVPEADHYFRKVWWDALQSYPGAFVVSVVKRLPLALAPPYSFGFANPLKTRTFTEIRGEGQDRYQAILSNPLYVLAAYWDVIGAAIFSGLALLASIWWLIVDRHRWTLVLLILSVHLYSIGAHLIIHMEPRFLLPSMFVFLLGLARFLTRHRQVDRELR